MNPLLKKGRNLQKELGEELLQTDLYPVPSNMTTSSLVHKFEQLYRSYATTSATTASDDVHSSSTAKTQRPLTRTLWELSKPIFIPAGFCQLITVVCQVIMPLLVRELLQQLEQNPDSKIIREGLPYTIGIFLCLFFNALANHRHRHLATKTGILLRSALVGIIYNRVLRLLPQGRSSLSSGEINTLIAIDTQKLFEVTQEAHLAWSMPMSMALVTIFLILITGPTAIVGLIVLVAFVPIVERVASKMLGIRHERVKKTDERVEIVSSMLQGIKVTKLNNYEENYKARIDAVRDEEHRLLQRELAWWAASLFITVVSPMLASASTFATYVLVDESNVLRSSRTFTVLLLFQALRFPISYTGRLIGRAAQALESIRRIDKFLQRSVKEEAKDERAVARDSSPSLPTDAILSVENGTFTISTVVDKAAEAAGDIDSTMGKSQKEQPNDKRDSIGDTSASRVNTSFSVSNINFSVKRGEILAIVGPVGSGKSTIMNGIIGEVEASDETKLSIHGATTYVSQTPLVLNATLRDNILFGLPFDEEWYNKVIEACCLIPDLKQLGASGDLTEIGERGVTLSGGQKQRVSIARAVYAKPDLLLMDDPISALDAGTARKIFDTLMNSKASVLKDVAMVLVTHASHFLNRVDDILVVVDGQGKFHGTWSELSYFESHDKKTMDAIDFIVSSVQEDAVDEEKESVSQHNVSSSSKASADPKQNFSMAFQPDKIPDKDANKKKDGRLITVEERKHGLSSLRTWTLWFRYAGGFPFIFVQVFLMTLDRIAYVASEYWLARWTEGVDEPLEVFGIDFPAQTDGRSAQYEYLQVYAIIIVIGMVFTLARSEWAVTGGTRCSKRVFRTMLGKVLLAPISYFESTPLGRILNRFTYDTEVIDITLTEAMSILMIAMGWFVAGVVIMLSILPWIGIALVPALAVYWNLSYHYRMSGTDLQRLDAVARSPIQAMVSEGLEGSTTIRVFGQTENFVNKFVTATDKSGSALLNFISAQRWLGVRIEILGSLVVLVACILVISMNDTLGLPPGIVALLIIWSSNFTITLGFLVDYFAEGEAAITSIERVDAMTTIPQEHAMDTDATKNPLSKSWPSDGTLDFDNVCLRYRDGLPLALDSLSFQIPGGKRVGVVGRTGAGKSSLTVALFRLTEIESGRILLDGVDLAKIGLKDVRGRPGGMSIIPQDPFIAGTTLRECVDPFGTSSDDAILDALVSVRLVSPDASSDDALETEVAEGGSNFSVGERQLLNLARALLAKPKVLLLDEATASIDGETDALIQKMLRERFKETTLITIAHRLNTIMDYDLILVMDKGRAVEFGNPVHLLEQKGLLFELVNATGEESSRALHGIARLSLVRMEEDIDTIHA